MAESIAIGYIGSVCIGKQVTYADKVVVTQKQALISENISTEYARLKDMTLQGRAHGRQSDLGHQTLSGDITCQLRYGTGNLLLDNWFGQNVAGTCIPLLTTHGLGLTIVIDKGINLWELGGMKVNKAVIAATTTGINVTYSLVGTISPDDDDILNTQADVDLLRDADENLLFTDLVFRLGERVAALSAANEYGLGSFTLTLDRPQDEVFDNTSRAPIEPIESGFRVITLAALKPRYDTQQWETWKRNGTRLHGSLVFTAEALGSRSFLLPNVDLLTVPSPLDTPGALSTNMTADCTEAESQLRSTAISAAAADNSLNIAGGAAVAATGTLTLTGVATDGETVTIGADVYEVDTRPGSLEVGAGRIQVDLAGGVTRQAKGTLTLAVQPTAGDTFTIGAKVYTMQANGALTNVNGNIEIGASLAASKTNIVNAINRTGVPGTGYAAAMTQHTTVSIAAFIADAAVVTALSGGVGGNSIVSTETFFSASNLFDAATLGTTQVGVNPTATELVAGLIAAVSAAQTAGVSATDGAGDTVVVTALESGADGNDIVTTDGLANGSWGAATLTGGSGSSDEFALAPAGSTVYVTGMPLAGNNGIAPLVSWTATKLILANAAAGGFTLTDAVAGPSVKVVVRSPDVLMLES